jgi:alanine racemase
MVDVSDVEGVQPRDEVILFGEEISVDEVAGNIGTIVNDVVCAVGKRVPRIYVS